MRILKFQIILLLLLLFLNSCKKEDFTNYPGNLTSVKIPKKPELLKKVKPIKVPDKLLLSQNSYAQQTVNYVNIANSISDYFKFLSPPANAWYYNNSESNYIDTYIWYISTYKVKLLVSSNSDTYFWEVYISDSQEGFEDKFFISASESINGLNGKLMLNDINSIADYNMEWYWYYDTQNSFHFQFSYPSTKINIIINTDLSGELKYYYDQNTDTLIELIHEMFWNSSGSGTWKYYENNINTQQGSWTV